MSYQKKLEDQRWQKKRLERFEAVGWKCTRSGCDNPNPNKQLHVHHKVYFRGRDPWDYPDWALQVVCNECHPVVQQEMEQAHSVIAQLPDLQEFCLRFYTESTPESDVYWVETVNLARCFLMLGDAFNELKEASKIKAVKRAISERGLE